jgi:flavin-dependent dehydrogenase
MTDPEVYDVAIIGGGLAGLSLAIQLKRSRPAITVAVIEKSRHPLPEAAHKVGESSVEIGARYFSQVLGLTNHLRERELPKLGLRFFFSAKGNRDIAERLEFGTDTFFAAGSYQLDRGRFENHLGEQALALGADFRHGATIRGVELGSGGGRHAITVGEDGASERRISCRWLVDASGRSAMLKRRLGLGRKVGHQANAVWFRYAERIALDDWCEDPLWQGRNHGRRRWLSTNHLMGPGYWVWLIPLGSGSTSVGIVVDARMHPLATMSSYDKALNWLAQHEPQCFEKLEGRRELLQDFRLLKDYSYSCETAFHADRWCLVGEACAFLDPFYSPGSDYIAMGNTMATSLIMGDLAGGAIGELVPAYNGLYFALFASNLTLFENQYPLYGNALVMSLKIVWDWAYYWSVSAAIFCHGRLCDLAVLLRIRRSLKRAIRLNGDVQALLRRWSEAGNPAVGAGFVNCAQVPFMVELNRKLTDTLDEEAFVERFSAGVTLLKRLAGELSGLAAGRHPGLDLGDLASGASAPGELLAPVLAMIGADAVGERGRAGPASRPA